MSNKRSTNEETRDSKRTKVEDSYELALGGGVYIDMDKLFKCPALKAYFNKKYKRSVAQLIKQEKFCVIYATKNGIAEGVLHMKTVYAPKSDARLVKKGENVERIIMLAKSSSLDLAPPVITDEDLSFFVDEAGTRHEVEMRGMRTMAGIFFKAKDVARVFKSDRFVDSIQDPRTSYRPSVDFVWFTLLAPEDFGNRQSAASDIPRESDISTQVRNQSRDVFLTFEGLMHALHSTRTQVAGQFRKWVYTQVFAIAYGTPAQKRAMVSQLCRVDKSFLEAFLKIVPSDISCLYLVDTAMREDGKKVYKFGRSKKLKERFYQHSATFGEGIILDTIVFVPQDCLSEAEALLNHSITEDLRFHIDEARELLLLDCDGYKVIRTIMQTVADRYNGSMALHATLVNSEMKEQASRLKSEMKDQESQLKSEMKDQESQLKSEMKDQALTYELRVKDLERMIEVLEIHVKHTAAEEKSKAADILHQVQQKLTEENGKTAMLKQQLVTQLETHKLQLRVLRLEYDAQLAETLAEKDLRIAELEEANRRLGKNFPEAA